MKLVEQRVPVRDIQHANDLADEEVLRLHRHFGTFGLSTTSVHRPMVDNLTITLYGRGARLGTEQGAQVAVVLLESVGGQLQLVSRRIPW